MESGRITLSVRGNYEQMLLRRIELAETNPGEHTWMMHPWFTHDVERADWGKWKAIIKSIPVAATVDTAPGPVAAPRRTEGRIRPDRNAAAPRGRPGAGRRGGVAGRRGR